MMRLLPLFCLLGLSFAAHSAQQVCPDGYSYHCVGGIEGVTCWCSAPPSECLLFDLDAGAAAPSTAHVAISLGYGQTIESTSDCEIGFTVELDQFEGETVTLGRGSLTAENSVTVLTAPPLRETGRRIEHFRIRGEGAAHQCAPDEYLNLQILTTVFDETTGVLETTPVKADFVRIVDEHTPPGRTPPPSVLPPRQPNKGSTKRK